MARDGCTAWNPVSARRDATRGRHQLRRHVRNRDGYSCVPVRRDGHARPRWRSRTVTRASGTVRPRRRPRSDVRLPRPGSVRPSPWMALQPRQTAARPVCQSRLSGTVTFGPEVLGHAVDDPDQPSAWTRRLIPRAAWWLIPPTPGATSSARGTYATPSSTRSTSKASPWPIQVSPRSCGAPTLVWPTQPPSATWWTWA